MSDKQALEAVLHGETLDQTTIKRLWIADLVSVTDVTDHDTRPIGARELMVTLITPKGKRLVQRV
jgi:acetolactate synthase small subunit